VKIDPKYVIYHDLIGLETQGKLKSKKDDSEYFNLGTVIDESKNMLIIEKEKNIKKYIKKDHVFRFKLPKSKKEEENIIIEVNGLKIVGLPENRLRALKKKKRRS